MIFHRHTPVLLLMILCLSDLYAEFDGSFINNVTDHYATPHLEWRTDRAPLNIFFLSTRYGARDIVELGQRFPVKRTVFLMERPRRKAVHYDESRIMEIRRLAEGTYDLIVIARGDFTMLPPDVQYTILDKIRNGTGLLLIGGRLPYRKLFEHRLPAPLFLRETVWTENFKPRRVSAFAFGKGRILHLPWNGEGLTPDFMPGRCWMANYENAMLILMRAAWWAAGQDSERKYQVRKTMDSWQIVPSQKVSYRWRDEENHILGSGSSAEGVIPVPQGVPAGKYFCDRIMEGALPSVGEERVQSPLGAVSVTLDSQFLRRDQAIKGTIRLSQKALSDYSAVLELSDALNGNIWERKTIHIPAGSAEREFRIADYYPPELGGYLKVIVSDGTGRSPATAQAELFFRAKKIDSYFQVGWEGPRNPIMARQQNENEGFSIALNPYPFDVRNVRKLALMNTHIIPYMTSIWLKKTPSGEVMIRMQGRSQEKLKKLGKDHSFHRPEIRRLWEEQIVEKMHGTAEYGPVLYSLGDENILDAGGGYGPSDEKGFRDFLRRKYGTVEKLNSVWKKNYPSFEAVEHRRSGIALQEKNFPEWNDHLEYMEEMFILFHEFSARIIKRIDPAAQVGTEGTFGQIDMEKFMKNLDWWGPYPSPVENEVMRSLFPDMPRFLWVGYLHEREQGRLPSCLEYIVKGTLNGIGWFSCDPDSVYGYFSPDYSESYPEKFTAEIRRLRFGTAQLLIDIPLLKSGISIYWNHLSRRAMKADPRCVPPSGIAPFIKTCYEHGIGFEFVTAQTLKRLKDTGILFLLGISSMSRKEADAIREYVRNGGVVIADMPPALFDEYLQVREVNPLAELFGALTLKNLPSLRVAAFNHHGFKADKVLQSSSGEFFRTREYGKGKAVLLNFHFGFASNSADPETPFSRMILHLLRRHGVQPPWQAENCEIFRIRTGKDFSLLSFYSRDRQRKSRVNLSERYHVYECGRGYAGRDDTLHVSYTASTMQLFALFKEKQIPPAVQVRSRHFAGEDLIFDLRAVPAGRTLLFRVYDPAGKEKSAASRSVNTGKETNFRFRMPFNAAEGIWTFHCTDMASGLRTEKKIAIEKRK